MMKWTTKPSRQILLNTTELVGNLSQTYLTIQLSTLSIYWLGMNCIIYVRNRTELDTNELSTNQKFSVPFHRSWVAVLEWQFAAVLYSSVISKITSKDLLKIHSQDDRGSFSNSTNFGFKFKVKGGSAVRFNPILLMPGIFASGLWVVL